MKRNKLMKAIIVTMLLISLVLSGCMSGRGWPGVVSEGDIMLIGTVQGKILFLNMEDRTRVGEWEPKSEGGRGFLACAGGGAFSVGSIYGAPVVADGVVYVGSYNGKVYAVNIETKMDKWFEPYDTDSAIVGGVAVAGDTLFVGTSDGRLHAVEVATGLPKMGFYFEAEDKIWSEPVIQDGIVYFGSLDKRLYAVYAGTGELKWNTPFEAGGGIASRPLVVDGVIYVGSFDSNFYAIDAETGIQKWVFEGASDWFWSNAVYDGGTVYAASLDGNVYALDAGRGELVWPKPFETAGPVKSSPVITDGLLVVASENGEIYGLDLETGSVRWPEIDLETKILAPLYLSQGKVYVNAQDNKLHMFDGATGQPDWPLPLDD